MNVVGHIIRADSSGAELLIWLVVTVIWVVAQALAKARKNQDMPKPAVPPSSPRTGSSGEPEDIEEFFRLLRQQFEAGEAKPATPPPPPPVSRAVSAPPPSPVRSPSLPKPAVPKRKPKPAEPPPVQVYPAMEPPMLAQEIQVSTQAYAGPQVSFESVRRDILSLKVGFSSRGLRLPDVRITSQFHRRAAPPIQSLFHGREGLKKAMIARQVLGAPRSLRAWLYPED
jgi:hypothetical protein